MLLTEPLDSPESITHFSERKCHMHSER